MPSSLSGVSATLRDLIDKGVLNRIPVSFSAFCIDQIREWEILFPAERSYYERLLSLLDRSSVAVIQQLFAPIREIEPKMGVNQKTWPSDKFTLEQVDFLNRNPYYPEWRNAVAAVFAEVDPLLDAEIARVGHARLVVVLAPPQLPVDPGRLWTRLEGLGRRIAIDAPERLEDFVPLLLTGTKDGPAPTIAERFAASPKGGMYSSWIVESGIGLSRLGVDQRSGVRYSYTALETYRKRLMQEVQHIVESQQATGPRQLSARLKQMKILASEGGFAHDPILAEFARAILLSGNGTLLLNNTFVEWAAVQAVRRARPSVTLIGFGIRNKIKPFSNLLIYADQEAVSPIPAQMDTLGSYVDLEIFYQYIWQEFEKYAEYRKNTVYLFAGEGMDEALIIAPSDFSLQQEMEPVSLPRIFRHLADWLGV